MKASAVLRTLLVSLLCVYCAASAPDLKPHTAKESFIATLSPRTSFITDLVILIKRMNRPGPVALFEISSNPVRLSPLPASSHLCTGNHIGRR